MKIFIVEHEGGDDGDCLRAFKSYDRALQFMKGRIRPDMPDPVGLLEMIDLHRSLNPNRFGVTIQLWTEYLGFHTLELEE